MEDATERFVQVIVTQEAVQRGVAAMGNPVELIVHLRGMNDWVLDQGVGSRIGTSIRRGDATVCDLLIAAIWLAHS